MIARPQVEQMEAYGALGSVCAALGLAGESLVAVLTVYLDESYNQHTAKDPNDPLMYTVGCWLSSVNDWNKFEKEWNAALRSAGIEWFHMSEFESRLGDYEDWGDLKRVGVLKRLHRVVKTNTMYGLANSVNCAEFDEIINTPELKRQYGKTYYSFNVRMIMLTMAHFALLNNHPGPINYVFAELKGQGNELDRIFRERLKDREAKNHFRLSSMWTKGLMRDVGPLQAADIVAYETNKRAVSIFSGKPTFMRRSLQNLVSGIYGAHIQAGYFGKAEISRMVAQVKARGLKL